MKRARSVWVDGLPVGMWPFIFVLAVMVAVVVWLAVAG
jgi:hypothetical protein